MYWATDDVFVVAARDTIFHQLWNHNISNWFWGSRFWWSYFYMILGLMLNQVKRVFMKQVLLLEMTLNKESLNWAASSSLSILYFREMSWGLNNSILNYKTFSLNMINYSVNFVVLKKFLTYTWGSYNGNSNWLKMNNIKRSRHVLLSLESGQRGI